MMGRLVIGVIYAMFFLSGGAAPVYQVVRARSLTVPEKPFLRASL